MSVDELRTRLHEDGRDWWVCRCGRHLDRHSNRTVPNTGGREAVCSMRESGRFEPVTLPELNYSFDKGVHKP